MFAYIFVRTLQIDCCDIYFMRITKNRRITKYSKTDLGAMSEIAKRENGKAFLHDALNLTSCEVSINVVPTGFKVPFNHVHHQNEEVYIILSGLGIITVDGEQISVKAGSAVRIATGVARTIENTGAEQMQFICIQAKENSLTQFGFADADAC